MTFSLALSHLAMGMALDALLLSLVAFRWVRRPAPEWRKTMIALATLALGMALFALFFGLVAACDRL